jgi:hypothetical protein
MFSINWPQTLRNEALWEFAGENAFGKQIKRQ